MDRSRFRRVSPSLPAHAVGLAAAGFLAAMLLTPKCGVASDAEKERLFETHVRPLLVEHCYECHSAESGESAGELRLDSAPASRRGGTRGPAVVPGDPQASLLIKAIGYDDFDLQMPPGGKLPEEAIRVLEAWIAGGAFDPRTDDAGEPADEPAAIDPAEHWAFQLPQPAAPPEVIPEQARDVIDAVAIARAREAGLSPAAAADRETLFRRLVFDLTGLPPTRAAIDRFVQDPRPDALQRVIDRLLADPAFGQRWARHWLDVARYAETIGYALAGVDPNIEGAYRYRDWTIRALNGDMPYDEMIRLQLAADRYDPENERGNLDALGFLTLGRRFINNRHLIIDDRIDVVSRGLMGLTVACARCHDHKFDPIPTADYYSWYGIFDSSEEPEEGASPLQLVDTEKPREPRIFLRGNAGNRGDVVPRRFLTALAGPDAPPFEDGSGRRELADEIASEDNPLTGRVFVNRVWMHLTGQPLVDTPSDFGVRSEPSAQPEVLDDLTVEFLRHGWSTKRLIRRIATSHLYTQSSAASAEALQADPTNRLLARANRRRRDFESTRDSVLAVSGWLQRKVGGPSVDITTRPNPPRRTLYARIDRQDLPGVFRAFDFASPDAHASQRYYTTVPQQALYLMNSPFLLDAAVETSRQIAGNVGDDPAAWVTRLFDRVLQRAPAAEELDWCLAFLASEPQDAAQATDPRTAWQYGRAVISKEGLVQDFTSLPAFHDGRWQGGEKLPDAELGWVSLTAEGGHPGTGLEKAAVRRWIAPEDGHVVIDGYAEHPSKEGDGVRLTISTPKEKRWQIDLKSRRRPVGGIRFPVRAGEPVDFVVDANGSTSHDSFRWAINLHWSGTDGVAVDFDSSADFSGPLDPQLTRPLSRREQLAQALLMSNEFIFVD